MAGGGRVLIVEDDWALRETLAEVLLDEGYEVEVASHGGEALDVLDRWQPDLVLLDLMMPVMDGYQFRERQRELGHAPSAKVVVFSAAHDLEVAAARLGAAASIAKPFGVGDIVGLVERQLGGASDGAS